MGPIEDSWKLLGTRAAVIAFQSDHRIIHILADARQLRTRLELRPACFDRHPEHIGGKVLVLVLRIRVRVVALALDQLDVVLVKRVADVFEEDQTQTTCLYSAASMLFRSLSVASHSLASKPILAELDSFFAAFFAMDARSTSGGSRQQMSPPSFSRTSLHFIQFRTTTASPVSASIVYRGC